MEKYNKLWRILFLTGITGLCVQQLILGSLLPLIVPLWPKWLPGEIIFTYFLSAAIVTGNLIILFDKKGRLIATSFGFVLMIIALLFHVPYSASHYPAHLGSWSNVFEILALSGCYFIVAGSIPDENMSGSPVHNVLMPGTFFYSIAMITFGMGHFLYAKYMIGMVPTWLPWHTFWLYLAGAGLIAAGTGMLLNIKKKLAAAMLGMMISAFLLLLHIPGVISDPYSNNGGEWVGMFTALAFSSTAFLIAGMSSENLNTLDLNRKKV